jgi:hypothetical protein
MTATAIPDTLSRHVPSGAHGRLLPLTGLAFIACFIGSVVASNPPKNSASDRAWIASYTGSANKAHHVITGVFLVLAAISLLTFLTALWRRIGDAQPGITRSPIAVAASAAGASAIAVGGVVMGAAGPILTGHTGPGVANLFRLANGLGFALVALGGMPAIALAVVCLSVDGRRAAVFGRGVSTFGIVAAIALLAALAFVPIVLLLAWVLAVSVTLLRAPQTFAA